MTSFKRISLLVLLGACLAAAGCGGDEEEGAPLPQAQIQLLEGRLTETENRLADGSVGACEDILNDSQPEVQRVLDSLPEDVDPDVRSALQDSFARLWEMVAEECRAREADEPEQTETQEEPIPTPTETTTEPTETAPPEEEEETPPEEEELPPDGDGNGGGTIPPGNGNGNGNGVGNGGGVGPGSSE